MMIIPQQIEIHTIPIVKIRKGLHPNQHISTLPIIRMSGGKNIPIEVIIGMMISVAEDQVNTVEIVTIIEGTMSIIPQNFRLIVEVILHGNIEIVMSLQVPRTVIMIEKRPALIGIRKKITKNRVKDMKEVLNTDIVHPMKGMVAIGVETDLLPTEISQQKGIGLVIIDHIHHDHINHIQSLKAILVILLPQERGQSDPSGVLVILIMIIL